MLLLGAATLFLRRLRQRVLFLCLSDATLFLLGAQLTLAADERNSRWHYTHYLKQDGKQTWLVVPDDLPRHTTKFTRCRVKLLAVQQGKSWQEVSGGALLYIRHSGTDSLLQPGTQLVVKAQLQPLPAALNPGEFDYKAYMRQRNIYHAAFADSGALVILPAGNPLHPVWATGLACKQMVLRNLKHSGLSSDAYAVCAALLTGYDDDIDPELMRSFAHSGTLHVLSVSGLHTGLIYLVLNLLLDVFDRHRRYGKLRFALLTGLLWGFALLTGFPPPVLRAVIQLNLLGLGAMWFRSPGNNQLNLLLVSAFALLLVQPLFVCDLGFLLSYSAMIGLICLQPQLGALWQPKPMLLRLFWQNISASAAATVSTLPLTLFFFKQFPIWFALMNLVVVPLTFVMLFLALLVLVHAPFVTALANLLMRFLSWCVTLSDSPGLGFVDGLDVDLADACLMALFILLLALAWHYRRPPVLLAAWVVLLGWQLLALQRSWSAKHSSHVTIYALRGRSQLAVKKPQHPPDGHLPTVDLRAVLATRVGGPQLPRHRCAAPPSQFHRGEDKTFAGAAQFRPTAGDMANWRHGPACWCRGACPCQSAKRTLSAVNAHRCRRRLQSPGSAARARALRQPSSAVSQYAGIRRAPSFVRLTAGAAVFLLILPLQQRADEIAHRG